MTANIEPADYALAMSNLIANVCACDDFAELTAYQQTTIIKMAVKIFDEALSRRGIQISDSAAGPFNA